jgi:hypothetical protein
MSWWAAPRCSYPGCKATHVQKGASCAIHGNYLYCRKHRGIYLTDPLTDITDWWGCPTCRGERDAKADRERASAEAEAARRNAEVKKPITFDQALVEYRAQGFQGDAAEALATRRTANEWTKLERTSPSWTAAMVLAERIEAERQRRIAEGTLAKCRFCGKFAHVNQGVILTHTRTEIENSERESGSTTAYRTCGGTGTVISKS